MKRRQFFGALGAAIAIVAAKPVAVARPVIMVSDTSTISPEMLDWINMAVFAYHAQQFPEHREFYRTKAMNILARHALDRKESGL